MVTSRCRSAWGIRIPSFQNQFPLVGALPLGCTSVLPQPPPLLSCPSRKKTPTWYKSGKTLSVSENSSEKESRVVPSGQLQSLHCFLQLQRKVMTMATHCCWDTGHTLLPHILPQPPALAYSWKALVTWHSWEPLAAGPYDGVGQPRQGTEGSAGCFSPAPTSWALPLLTAGSVLLDLVLKINR